MISSESLCHSSQSAKLLLSSILFSLIIMAIYCNHLYYSVQYNYTKGRQNEGSRKKYQVQICRHQRRGGQPLGSEKGGKVKFKLNQILLLGALPTFVRKIN